LGLQFDQGRDRCIHHAATALIRLLGVDQRPSREAINVRREEAINVNVHRVNVRREEAINVRREDSRLPDSSEPHSQLPIYRHAVDVDYPSSSVVASESLGIPFAVNYVS
jgi:hypothetical protein